MTRFFVSHGMGENSSSDSFKGAPCGKSQPWEGYVFSALPFLAFSGENALQEFSSFLPVYLSPSGEECLTDLCDTATFTSCNGFQFCLQFRSHTKCKSRVFPHGK